VRGQRLFFYLAEVTSPRAFIADSPLEKWATNTSPHGKNAKDFSELKNIDGVDFLTFVSAGGESCVAIKKRGPFASSGNRWIFFATRCARNAVSHEEIIRFIAEAQIKA
ncbi:MAG TPA: hypothetical protein VEC14_04760, partial [Reyranellaceae bacterium]|nr:hypothetical protein [Reyranellaceae bacterium]